MTIASTLRSRLLDLDARLWLAHYRAAGVDSMSGRLASMTERVHQASIASGQSRSLTLVADVVRRNMSLFYASVRLDDEAWTVLDCLGDAGVPRVLVSNASSYSEQILDILQLRSRFSAIVLSYRLGVMKPNSQIYRVAASAVGCAPSCCVFVGDGADEEMFGARAVGMHAILVDRGLRHTEAARQHADVVCSRLSDVIPVIASHAAERSYV